MKKKLSLILALAGLLWVGTIYAGNMCWMDGTGGYWKTYVTKPDGVSSFETVTGVRYNPATYVLPVTGTLQKSLGDTTLRLSVTGTYVSTSGVIHAYFFDATLDAITKSGTIWCLEKTDIDSFVQSTILAPTECSNLPPY